MAQPTQPSNYVQGHSKQTISTHLQRTAETDAAFLLPHIKPTDRILDVGCGPGTITTGLARYASEGSTIGVDISAAVLQTAKSLAADAAVPTQGPGSVAFEQANVLERLPHADSTFDVVFASQVFGHLPLPDLPLRALAEMRRVLKPGGVLATRDGAYQHFYPRGLDLDRLWVGNFGRAIRKGGPEVDPTATCMPALLRKAGFDADGGKVQIGASATVSSGSEARERLAGRAAAQLKEGDAFHQSWLDAGIAEEEIQETLRAVAEWAGTEDAWYAATQIEMLAWK